MPAGSSRRNGLQHPEDLWNHLKRRAIGRRQQTIAERAQQTEIELAAVREKLSKKLQVLSEVPRNLVPNPTHSQHHHLEVPAPVEKPVEHAGSGRFNPQPESKVEKRVEEEGQAEMAGREEDINDKLGPTVDQMTSDEDEPRFTPGLGINLLPQPPLPTLTNNPSSFPARGITKPNNHFLIPLTRSRNLHLTFPDLPAIPTPQKPHPTQRQMPPHSPTEPFEALHPLWGPLMTDHAAFTHVQRPLSSFRGREVGNSPDLAGKEVQKVGAKAVHDQFSTLAILNSEGVYRRRCAEAGFGGMRDVGGLVRRVRGVQQTLREWSWDKATAKGKGKERSEVFREELDEDVEGAVEWLREKGCFGGSGGSGWCGEGAWDGRRCD